MKNTAICGEVSLVFMDTKNGKNFMMETIRREAIKEELDLAWLAGLIDGEGCFSAYFVADHRRGNKPLICRVVLAISNSSRLVIEKVKEVVNSLGVRGHMVFSKRKDRKFWVGNLYIAGNNNLLKLIPRLMPYLVLKQEQASIMLNIIARKNELRAVTEGKKGKTYSNDDVLLAHIKRLQELKQDGKFDSPSTTIRRAPQNEGDDIVSSA